MQAGHLTEQGSNYWKVGETNALRRTGCGFPLTRDLPLLGRSTGGNLTDPVPLPRSHQKIFDKWRSQGDRHYGKCCRNGRCKDPTTSPLGLDLRHLNRAGLDDGAEYWDATTPVIAGSTS